MPRVHPNARHREEGEGQEMSNEHYKNILTAILAFIIGVIFAVSNDSTVVVKGEKGGVMVVDYKDKAYRLVEIEK